MPDIGDVRLILRYDWPSREPDLLQVHCRLFSRDPGHKTFLALYRGANLERQEKPSMRGITRIFGVSRPTLILWLKKDRDLRGALAPQRALQETLVPAQEDDVLELDEVWSFNATLRGRVGRLVRRTLSFSKSHFMHLVHIRLFLHQYNHDCPRNFKRLTTLDHYPPLLRVRWERKASSATSCWGVRHKAALGHAALAHAAA